MAKHPQTVSSESTPSQKKTKRVSSQPALPHQIPPPGNSLVYLPEDILENVFTFLPIRNAVEACTVSTRFKRSWTLNRKFMFGREYALHYSTEDLTALIDRLFDSHKGPEIQSFQLHINPVGVEPLIQKWLQICIEKGIQEIEFQFFEQGFTLGSDFLHIQSLKILKLYNCEIELPPVLKGLQNLHTVVLRQIELTEERLENLIFYCKMLGCLDLANCSTIRRVNILARNHRHFRTLKIAGCPNVGKIDIDAPTLRSIYYCGVIMKIRFAQVVPLSEAVFNFVPTRNYMHPSDVEALINHLLHVRVLTTTALFQEALAGRVRDGIFQELRFGFWNLRELQLFMEGGMFCNPYDIAVFLRNCPSLEMLFIDLNDYHFECGVYWELHQKHMLDAFSHYFNRLRFVKLKGFKFLRSELELVKVLLQKSLFLEALFFITPKSGRTKLYAPDAPKYDQLFSSWKASPKAKVVLLEHSNDKSGILPSHPKYWY